MTQYLAITGTFLVAVENVPDDRARRRLEYDLHRKMEDIGNIHEDGVFLFQVTGLRPHRCSPDDADLLQRRRRWWRTATVR